HGEASLDLLKMAREELTLNLRTAVSKAIKTNTRTRQNGDVAIEVIPYTVPPGEERFFLVLFQPTASVEPKAGKPKPRAHSGGQVTEVKQLREELASTRESLQAI